VDTEGLGALDEDSNHDVRIFSLAVLLSSYAYLKVIKFKYSSFIYNSVGSIDESALSNLSLVINLTKHIHIKSRGATEDVDTEEYGTYFPSFMWVVRDFAL
jgi:Guanylate-binding protein, N-terminal domain